MNYEEMVKDMFSTIVEQPEKYFREDSLFYAFGKQHSPCKGPEEMKRLFEELSPHVKNYRFEIEACTVRGNKIIVERIEYFDIGDHHIVLPVVGIGILGPDNKFDSFDEIFDHRLFRTSM